MHLIGRYYHALEQKGRLSIPASFREQLGTSIILSTGIEPHITVYCQGDWNQIMQQYAQLSQLSKNARDWQRLLAHNAHQVSPDKLGRIRIPQHLIEYAQLKKQVVVAGTLNHLEIWDQAYYHAYFDDISNRVQDITRSLEEKAS